MCLTVICRLLKDKIMNNGLNKISMFWIFEFFIIKKKSQSCYAQLNWEINKKWKPCNLYKVNGNSIIYRQALDSFIDRRRSHSNFY